MARTVQPRRSNFPKRKYPLTYVGNQLYIARRAEIARNSYVLVPAGPDHSAIFGCDLSTINRDVSLSSQPSKKGILPPNKPNTRWRSKISSQDALGDKLARISLTPSQSSKKGILPPAPNKPYTRSSSKISSQDALEDKLARISLTPSQSSNKGILPPAPNKSIHNVNDCQGPCLPR